MHNIKCLLPDNHNGECKEIHAPKRCAHSKCSKIVTDRYGSLCSDCTDRMIEKGWHDSEYESDKEYPEYDERQ